MALNNKSTVFSFAVPRRTFPTAPKSETASTALSVLDASIAIFAPCSAIWFFDAESAVDARDPILFRNLELHFRETLTRWPHWAGQLRWAVDTDRLVNPRPKGRPVVTYGGTQDVGVDWIIARCDANLESVVPHRSDGSTVEKVWMATNLPCELEAATKLAFSNLAEFEGLPGMVVQLTSFKCGGWSVNVKLTHCLSDAQSLLTFMHAWAAQSYNSKTILSQPVFEPSLLDEHAGNLDLAQPNAHSIARARKLSMHRFDWRTSDAPGYPDWAMASSLATMPSSDVLETQKQSLSTHPPWPTWDMSMPVEHAQIRFTAAEVGRMKDAARVPLPTQFSAQNISRLDSLLSHVWMLINRARGHASSESDVYLDLTLGLRNRLNPPLPSEYVRSPLLLAYVARSGKDTSAGPLGHIACKIRSTLSQFTPEAMSACIHDAAYEASPQRLWQALLGSQHTLVTSWTHLRAYEVNFGHASASTPPLARYVQGVMPRLDGLVQVMNIGESGDYDVSLSLEKDAMARLLKDSELRAFM